MSLILYNDTNLHFVARAEPRSGEASGKVASRAAKRRGELPKPVKERVGRELKLSR